MLLLSEAVSITVPTTGCGTRHASYGCTAAASHTSAAQSGLVRSSKLSQPPESLEMIGAAPHAPPPITRGREPSACPGGFAFAMRRLQLSAVDHAPAASRFDREARMDVAWVGVNGRALALRRHALILSATGAARPATPRDPE